MKAIENNVKIIDKVSYFFGLILGLIIFILFEHVPVIKTYHWFNLFQSLLSLEFFMSALITIVRKYNGDKPVFSENIDNIITSLALGISIAKWLLQGVSYTSPPYQICICTNPTAFMP